MTQSKRALTFKESAAWVTRLKQVAKDCNVPVTVLIDFLCANDEVVYSLSKAGINSMHILILFVNTLQSYNNLTFADGETLEHRVNEFERLCQSDKKEQIDDKLMQ